jgi:bifunctional DNA-binding transcriptional regulator/antitoxin component of YhaV-PrlF toxin-antitoxin module
MSVKNSSLTIEPTVRIGPKHQITLPSDIFRKLQLEIGDFLAASISENEIILKPKKLIPKGQAWFWTKEWQRKEKEADEDIKEGRLRGPFTSAKQLINHLNGLKRKERP